MTYEDMTTKFPEYLNNLLWDVRKETVDINRHSQFVIRRVLDFGDVAAVNWLRRTYPDNLLKQVIKTGRGLTRKTIVFWRNYFDLETEDIDGKG
ncbi:MAG: hypothetical protein JSU92_09420 [Deltaproteobacteria bacterium]|nr:MAG: hypothetical protein JSU92_09420 [Deltaproteobacteria bacterium]